MANTVIQIRKSGVSGNVPVSLANGELALNYADGKMYYRNTFGQTGYIYSPNSFSSINISGSLILSTSNTDTLSIIGTGGITTSACTATKTITISGSNIISNTGTQIYVNNYSQFFVSNSAPTTNTTSGALVVTGGVGVSDSVYVGNKVGFVDANNVSRVYHVYNPITNTLDTVFG